MDLFLAAVVLRHPALIDDRLEADCEPAESITDATSAILKRLQVDGWEAFRVSVKKKEDLIAGIDAAADYIGTTVVTFLRICEENRIEPAHRLNFPKLKYLYRKSDLDPYVARTIKATAEPASETGPARGSA